MMNLRVATAALALAGTVAVPGRAFADTDPPFRLLSWSSSLNAICVDPECLKVVFTLHLNGFRPTGNTGNAIPGGWGGYESFFNLSSLGGRPWYAVVIVATFTSNPFQNNFALGGSAPPKVNGSTLSGPCAEGTCEYTGGTFDGGGGFGGTATATSTPEPLSMTLLATGLVGLMLVARRRKKQRAG